MGYPSMIRNEVEFTIPESTMENWQSIVDILAEIIEIPAALIMRLVDEDIEVFSASHSKGNPYHPGDREHFENSGLYCETVIKTRDRLLVPNALKDVKWKDNPDVKLNMIAYLGFPIYLPDNKPFGTICVLDNKENAYPDTYIKLLMKFRDLVQAELELIYLNQSLGDKNQRLSDYLVELQAFRGLVPICANCKSIRDEDGEWHPIENYLIQSPMADFSHGLCPVCLKKLYPDFAARIDAKEKDGG